MNDQDVLRTLNRYLPISECGQKTRLLDRAKDQDGIWLGITVKETNQLIGSTALKMLNPKDRSAEFGISIGAKDQWGKGYVQLQ